MYTLKTEQSFDSAHFLAEYNGKCKNIHGHRWTVLVEVMTENLETDPQLRGMYVDFAQLKDDLKQEVDRFDHAFIIEEGSLKEPTLAALISEDFNIRTVDFRPTAENFAKYFYYRIEKKGYKMKQATVYETPTNCASFYEV